MHGTSDIRSYVARVLIALALVGCAVLLWQLSDLVMVVFGAVVVAVMLNALVVQTVRHTPLSQGLALAGVLVLLVILFALLIWLFGAQLAGEIESLKASLPNAWAHFQSWLAESPVGPTVKHFTEQTTSGAGDLATRLGALAMSASGNLTQLVLMLAGGIYLAAQPDLYRSGLLKLFPADRRALVGEAMDASGHALKAWLVGQLLAMVVVGLLTGLGLWMLGVPVAFGLGIITAVLDFVPIAGPVLAAIPAVLLGFTVSPQVGFGALLVFVVIQQLESHVLQPLIQQRVVDLPPALLLISLFAIGGVFGLPGVVLAAPLTVVIFVLVKRLYVREALGTETHLPGEEKP